MQNNYFFLRQLTRALAIHLEGFTLVSCFTQTKDELVMEFNNSKSSFFIRATLSSAFTCLSFPEKFSRAAKNTVDIFPGLILKKVVSLRQYENERSFSILFADELILLFKMHGSRANIILLENRTVTEIFRHHLTADRTIDLSVLDRTIDWSKEFFLNHQKSLQKEYFTLGKPTWNFLLHQGFNDADPEIKWEMLQRFLLQLNIPDYFICQAGSSVLFLLLPLGEVLKQFSDPVVAVTEYYFTAVSSNIFMVEKMNAMRTLQSSLKSGEAYIERNFEKLHEIENDNHYKVWADLIMANIHTIPQGSEEITAADFYDGGTPVNVPLKKNLSPQKNAELYFRKSKNQTIEVQKLRQSIAAKQKELEATKVRIKMLETETTIRGLRQGIERAGLGQKGIEKKLQLPYREVEYKGFNIWIGRNAESNDKLTQKFSYKDDLWLHAKDVSGSHVLIKHQSGKNFPKDVIERAAQLAAWNSKRKNDSLCPVAFTFKKYVRKRKGDPAGAVIVEREEVILVEPAA